MITHFMDMHSGGGTKVKPYEHVYVDQPESEARETFTCVFGQNPDNVTCPCCGEDYSVSEYKTLEEATRYERQTPVLNQHGHVERFDSSRLVSLEEYLKRDDVLFIQTKVQE